MAIKLRIRSAQLDNEERNEQRQVDVLSRSAVSWIEI
jgi:hypothetical protein